MGQHKQHKKAAPPPQRPELRFQEISAEKLRKDLVQLREAMGEGEIYHDFEMLVVAEKGE